MRHWAEWLRCRASRRPVPGRCLARLARGLAVLVLAGPAAAELPASQRFDRDTALAVSQGARGHQVADHGLVTSTGEALRLHAFKGRPLVLSLVFTRCHHTCPMITQRLAEAVEAARETFGQDAFNVLTLGFDSANDTPTAMAAFARAHGASDRHWTFASADAGTVERLAGELGFLFTPSPRGFDHLAQVSVLDPELVVHSQIYGDAFGAPALSEPLRQIRLGEAAVTGGLSGWLERVRLFCTVYDAGSGRYRFDYGIILAFVIGFASLLGVLVFIVRGWREHDRGASA